VQTAAGKPTGQQPGRACEFMGLLAPWSNAMLTFSGRSQTNGPAMKAMFALFVAFFPCTISLFAQSEGKKEEVVFTRQMNQRSLDVLKADVARQGIKLSYDNVRFGAEDQLEGITFTVKDATGRSFTAGTDQLVRGVWFGFEFTHVGEQATLLNVGTLVDRAAPGVKP
jgi:hypothetical protein